MSTVRALLVGALAVAGPGVVPVLALLGRRWVALFAAPVVGAVVIALGATVTVLLDLPLVAGWAAVGVAVTVGSILLGRRLGPSRDALRFDPLTVLCAVVGAGAAVLWAGSRAMSWDVHSFWYSRGRWFLVGPDYVREQLQSPFTSPYPGAPHAQYPPLPSATAGLLWELTGDVNYFAAKLVLAGVTAAALVLLSLGVARLLGHPRWLGRVGALLVPSAALYFATSSSAQGHQDLPYAVAGEAALVFGLLLPRRSAELTLSVVLSIMCGMVKNEGLVIAVLVAVMVSVRHSERRVTRFLLLGVPWLAALGSWRVALRLVGLIQPAPATPPGVSQADELAVLRPLPSPAVSTLLHAGAVHLWWLAGPLLAGLVVLVLVRAPVWRLPRPMKSVLLVHAVVAVPLLAATGLTISGGPGLPWPELLARTARYTTYPRLALSVCLLALAAAALRTAIGRPDEDPADPRPTEGALAERGPPAGAGVGRPTSG